MPLCTLVPGGFQVMDVLLGKGSWPRWHIRGVVLPANWPEVRRSYSFIYIHICREGPTHTHTCPVMTLCRALSPISHYFVMKAQKVQPDIWVTIIAVEKGHF